MKWIVAVCLVITAGFAFLGSRQFMPAHPVDAGFALPEVDSLRVQVHRLDCRMDAMELDIQELEQKLASCGFVGCHLKNED